MTVPMPKVACCTLSRRLKVVWPPPALAAGLRAGKPTVIVTFFGVQPLWGQRVAQLGVGPQPVPRGQLSADRLAYAIRIAATHGLMRRRAEALGECIRAEDGVGEAVRLINGYLEEHS